MRLIQTTCTKIAHVEVGCTKPQPIADYNPPIRRIEGESKTRRCVSYIIYKKGMSRDEKCRDDGIFFW